MNLFHQEQRPEPLINAQDYIALSSYIHYQLSGEPINWPAFLSLITGDKPLGENQHFLLEALSYLDEAYGEQKRRLGPLAILHPLRTVALPGQKKQKLCQPLTC